VEGAGGEEPSLSRKFKLKSLGCIKEKGGGEEGKNYL